MPASKSLDRPRLFREPYLRRHYEKASDEDGNFKSRFSPVRLRWGRRRVDGSRFWTGADLVVTSFTAPSTGDAGGSFTVTGTVANQGGTLAVGASVVIYLSPNSNVAVDGGQVGLDVYMNFLNPGQSWNFSIPVTLPANVANGNYYIGAVAIYGGETNTSNNTRSALITVTGGTTCSPDSYEPDNSATAAKAITLGGPQQHNHCEGSSDWMSFNATAGNVYGIIAQKVGDKASLAVSVYDKDGSTRLASSSSPWSVLSRMTWTAPANGTYYLKVAPYSGTLSSGANTDYRITLEDAQHPDFIVDSFWFQGAGLPGGIINVSDDVRNQGFADATSFDVSVYISQNPVVTAATGTLIGTRTVSSLAAGQSNAGSWLSYALPLVPDGTYYLATIANPSGANETVTSNNTSTVLPITIQAPTGCSQDSYEPDSVYTSANPIIVGADPQPHNHCQDSSDWLKFTAEAGKDYSIRITRTGGYSSACVQLYDTDGSTLLAGDCNNSPTAIDWHAAAAGTYYLDVTGYVGPGTDYTIQLQPQLPDLTQTLSSSWTTAVAGGFLDVYDAVSNIGYAPAGPFEVGIYSSTSGTATTADTLLASRSVSGLPVQTSPWDSNQAGYSVHFPVSMPTGTYYLSAIADSANAVTELNESNNTSTPIVVTVVAPPCAVDSYEDDDDPASAKPISAGETQSRNFCDDSLDWVSFTPTASGAYVVSSSAYENIEIYQADGITRIPSQDTGSSSTVSWVATANTTYYLKNYNGTGAYQLTAYSCAQDAFEEDDSPAAAHLISGGETQTRNFCEDRYDWAKFDAVGGTTYTISATNGVNLWLALYDTDGRTWLANGQLGSGQQKGVSLITWTAPASGTYYIQVNPVWGIGQNTDYTLSLK